MAATPARPAIVMLGFLLAAALAGSAVAAGADAPVVASLAVTGPPDCAGRADVMKQIARRSTRIRFDGAAAGGPALRVSVDVAPRAVAAVLSIAWPDGTRSERRLSAPTCAETADAIALVVVLALDPAAAAAAEREPPAPPPAQTARPASPPPRAEPPPPRPRPPGEPAGAQTAPPPPPAEKPAPPPPPSAEDAPAPPRSPQPDSAPPVVQATATPPAAVEPSPPAVHRLDVGAAVRVAHGPAPSLMPGLALIAGWERDTGSVLSWKVQLMAARHARGGWETPDGTADFTLDLVTLHLCPLRVGTPAARARLCASGTAGRIAAEGTGTLVTRSHSRPFAAAGAAATLAVSPHPRVELAASVEPQAPLIRDHFSFGPYIFHDVPAVVLFFGLGAAVTFP